MNYYIMHEDCAEALHAKFPKAIKYGSYVLVGELPADYEGAIVDIVESEITDEQLLIEASTFFDAEPSSTLFIVNSIQGDYLVSNHAVLSQGG
jgi:hypothetical protein